MGGRVAKVEVYEDAAGEFRWRLRAANGRVICTPQEGYTSRYGAWRAYRTTYATLDGAVAEHDV